MAKKIFTSTNTADLLEISAGSIGALETLTKEFRNAVDLLTRDLAESKKSPGGNERDHKILPDVKDKS